MKIKLPLSLLIFVFCISTSVFGATKKPKDSVATKVIPLKPTKIAGIKTFRNFSSLEKFDKIERPAIQQRFTDQGFQFNTISTY